MSCTANIRHARSSDVPALGRLAKQGFSSSPVYTFVRTKAKAFPKHTIRGYEREYAQLVHDPGVLFTVLELEVIEHVAVPLSQSREKECTGRARIDTSHSQLRRQGDKAIVGFAIWKLGSEAIVNWSLIRSIRCELTFQTWRCWRDHFMGWCLELTKWEQDHYASFRTQIASIFFKLRDIDPIRAAKVDELCTLAQET